MTIELEGHLHTNQSVGRELSCVRRDAVSVARDKVREDLVPSAGRMKVWNVCEGASGESRVRHMPPRRFARMP